MKQTIFRKIIWQLCFAVFFILQFFVTWQKFYIANLKCLELYKFTEKQAKTLGVRGWCMNTRNDTVKGEIEAPPNEFTQMRTWLEKTGSPTSRIDRVIFSDVKEMDNFTCESFAIKY